MSPFCPTTINGPRWRPNPVIRPSWSSKRTKCYRRNRLISSPTMGRITLRPPPPPPYPPPSHPYWVPPEVQPLTYSVTIWSHRQPQIICFKRHTAVFPVLSFVFSCDFDALIKMQINFLGRNWLYSRQAGYIWNFCVKRKNFYEIV